MPGFDAYLFDVGLGSNLNTDRQIGRDGTEFAAGFSTTNIDGGSAGDAKVETFHLHVISSLENDPFLVNAALTIGFQNYKASQTVPIGGAPPLIALPDASSHVFDTDVDAYYELAKTMD